MIRYVEIEKGDLTSSVVVSSLQVWLAHGWTLKETGAGVVDAAVHGEGLQAGPTPAPDQVELERSRADHPAGRLLDLSGEGNPAEAS